MVVMRVGRVLAVALLLAGVALAQNFEDELRARITGLHYMPLAEMARVQGDVHITVEGGVVSVLSGPPLLVQTAVENAKAIASIQGVTNLDITYHFVFADTAISVPTLVTVKRGNKLEQAVLRVFGRKTEKQV